MKTDKIRKELIKKMRLWGEKNKIPNITEKNAEFLIDFIKKHHIKNILEIGTANGLSSIIFWIELEKIGGNVTTIEFSQLAYETAQENILEAQLENTIRQYFWDAREIIPFLSENYDFIFIDGLKKASLDFYILALEKVRWGGYIIIDDVIKFRYKMEDLYEYLEIHQIPYEVIQIDPDDGIMILKK